MSSSGLPLVTETDTRSLVVRRKIDAAPQQLRLDKQVITPRYSRCEAVRELDVTDPSVGAFCAAAALGLSRTGTRGVSDHEIVVG